MRGIKRGNYIERWAKMIALLKLAPRTLSELSKLAELSKPAVRRFLDSLVQVGVARLTTAAEPAKTGGTQAYRWEWVA